MNIEVVGPNHIQLMDEEDKPPDPNIGNIANSNRDGMCEAYDYDIDHEDVDDDIMVDEPPET